MKTSIIFSAAIVLSIAGMSVYTYQHEYRNSAGSQEIGGGTPPGSSGMSNRQDKEDKDIVSCELLEQGACQWVLAVDQHQLGGAPKKLFVESSVKKRSLSTPVILSIFVNNLNANANTPAKSELGFVGNMTVLAGQINEAGYHTQRLDITDKISNQLQQITVIMTRSALGGDSKEPISALAPKLIYGG